MESNQSDISMSEMNNNKKKHSRSHLWIPATIVCAVAFLASLVLLPVLLRPDSVEEPDSPVLTEPAATESTVPLKSLDVETNYGTFQLSGSWLGEMRTQIIDDGVYTIRAFGTIGSHEEQHLFDVNFGGDGERVGYIADSEGQYKKVNVVLSEFEPGEDWAEGEILEFYGMQSELNSIIGQLPLLEEKPQTDGTMVAVQTPYLTLRYPDRWGKQLRTQVSGEETVTVSFFGTPEGGEECQLFDIILSGTGEDTVGFYTCPDGTQITVEAGNFFEDPPQDWSGDTTAQLYEMQDIINDILAELEQDSSFARS